MLHSTKVIILVKKRKEVAWLGFELTTSMMNWCFFKCHMIKMITFVLCNIFEQILYSESILTKMLNIELRSGLIWNKSLPSIQKSWNLGIAPSTASVQVYLSKKYFKKKMLKESWACLKPQHVSASCSIPLIKIWTWQQSEASRQYKNHVHHIRISQRVSFTSFGLPFHLPVLY